MRIETRYYTLRRENQFRIDLDEIRGLVDRDTRFVMVNTPHNPTGVVLSEAEMEALHDFCAGRGVPLIVDEVYHPIYHGAPARSASRLPHATVLGDFSKALCVSGVRVGWMIERDANRRRQYLNPRSHFTVSNTRLGEHVAALVMRHRGTIYGRAQSVAAKNLALLDRFFAEHADFAQWIRPAGGMIGFPWLASGGDTRPFCETAARNGLLLAPGDCFGMPEHFRIGFAAAGERFAEGIARFEEIFTRRAVAV